MDYFMILLTGQLIILPVALSEEEEDKKKA
ncbi:MAG: hypothetical protein ACI86H_002940 [bacterium]|jgi:hypothetical protein